MHIIRNGEIIVLTAAEIRKAYEEELHRMWRESIEDTIDINADNLILGEEFTYDEFVHECMLEVQERYKLDRNNYNDFDDVVFSVAESNGIWYNDLEDDDDED